ncbi:hypothetical protein ELI_0608 [Eubacterium callanderi]|uniref:Uncharacterized protein n=1 Tax=Eubacterium callanderi TaxID=53442 RepID=E3GIY9_9FIRM|nr:hypothetical protein ELI_0608 [Eubacterium callanderi]
MNRFGHTAVMRRKKKLPEVFQATLAAKKPECTGGRSSHISTCTYPLL